MHSFYIPVGPSVYITAENTQAVLAFVETFEIESIADNLLSNHL